MTGTYERPNVRPTTWPERLFVLGGLGLAALYTAAAVPLGADAAPIGLAWMAAVGWTVLASLALALHRGLRHRDWSAFARHEFGRDDGDIDEWAARTGRYEWLGDLEDRLHDDDHLRSHAHG